MTRYKKFRIPTVDAVAAACAVYRHFGNIVKKSELNDTSKTSKEMLLDHFSGDSQITVTDEDCTRADEVIAYIRQRNMLDTLAGRSNSPFFLGVATLLEKDTTSSNDIGMLVWAPKLVDDLTQSDDRAQDIRQICHNSRYIGTTGKGIELEFHVLNTAYIQDYNRFVHMGHDGSGNAVTFWHPTRLTGVTRIKGRVKSHNPIARYGNIPGTGLNYVKVK